MHGATLVGSPRVHLWTAPPKIDGRTQPGFVDRPVIELNGGALDEDRVGLILAASNSVVRGLVVSDWSALRENGEQFCGCAIDVGGGNNCIIEGNYVGTDATGLQARPALSPPVLREPDLRHRRRQRRGPDLPRRGEPRRGRQPGHGGPRRPDPERLRRDRDRDRRARQHLGVLELRDRERRARPRRDRDADPDGDDPEDPGPGRHPDRRAHQRRRRRDLRQLPRRRRRHHRRPRRSRMPPPLRDRARPRRRREGPAEDDGEVPGRAREGRADPRPEGGEAPPEVPAIDARLRGAQAGRPGLSRQGGGRLPGAPRRVRGTGGQARGQGGQGLRRAADARAPRSSPSALPGSRRRRPNTPRPVTPGSRSASPPSPSASRRRGGDPGCLAGARAKCAAVAAKIGDGPKGAGTKTRNAIAKACPGVDDELLATEGLGASAPGTYCGAIDVPLATAGDVAECLVRHHTCRVARLVDAEAPRARELLELGGIAP